MDHLFNNGTAYKIQSHTISKIIVITAHNVAYKSQKWKGMHLIDRDRLSNINSRSIHRSKSDAEFMNFEKLFAVEMQLNVYKFSTRPYKHDFNNQ